MARLVPLNKEVHRNTRVATGRGTRFGDGVSFCTVVPREFVRLITHYPILLSKDANSESFNFCVLLGFEDGENLFLNGDQWDADYIPLDFLRGPFRAGVSASDAVDSGTVLIDMDHPRVNSDEGERLFDGDGEPSTYLQGIERVMSELLTGVRQTRELVALLKKYELIEPVTMKAAFQDGQTIDVKGLFSVHDAALQALSEEAIVELHRSGYLPHLYVQQASSAHLGTLIARRNARIAAR